MRGGEKCLLHVVWGNARCQSLLKQLKQGEEKMMGGKWSHGIDSLRLRLLVDEV
jgi:hypothetical protein